MICLQTPSFVWSFQNGRQLASKPVHHKQRVARSSPFFRSVVLITSHRRGAEPWREWSAVMIEWAARFWLENTTVLTICDRACGESDSTHIQCSYQVNKCRQCNWSNTCFTLSGQRSSKTRDMRVNHEAIAECFACFSSGLLTSQAPV